MDRCDRLLAQMTSASLQYALVFKSENIRYLTGFTGEGNALIGENTRVILTDFRYIEQAGRQSPGFRVVRVGGEVKLDEALGLLVEDGANVGVETDCVTVDQMKMLVSALPKARVTSLEGIAEHLRRVKDEGEIALIRKACDISCRAFEKALGWIKAGMTEKQVQIALDHDMLTLGAERVSFDTIAAAGENGSLPHAIPGDRVLKDGDFLTLDFGALYQGYHADMTRTVAIGKPSRELVDMYNAVLEAQKIAMEQVAPGVDCMAVDRAARDFLDAKYPGAFGHGLGHGVGLLIHETPCFNTRDRSRLEVGHVVTVEPGVYLPGVGGVRIEDMGAVTRSGFDDFIDAPKQLISL